MSHHKDKPMYGRWKKAHSHRPDMFALLKSELMRQNIRTSDIEIADFDRWLVGELWQKYQEHCMEQQNIVVSAINNTQIVINNGTKGKPYTSQTIQLPAGYEYDFAGLEDIGLYPVAGDDNTFTITGIPTKTGDFTITLRCKWGEGRPLIERRLHMVINPDPRSLWRNIPTPTDVPFYKQDTDSDYILVEAGDDGCPRKDMVAASQRGRSHAQEGKPRDDHFQLFHCPESGWYIMAVADGAGSAKYSRKGSEIACNTVVDICKDKLIDNLEFEQAITAYNNAQHDPVQEAAARKVVGDMVYSIVGNAAYQAHKRISECALTTEDSKAKDFATTLMLAVCKKFDFGWFIGSFWVGDGAMCIYDKDTHTASLLGIPDEGEYSGQTRFLTMPEIFADTSALYKRLRFGIKKDFTALMLMTDGVSDPMFGTDANLNNVDKWDELWTRLKDGFPEDGIGGVDLTDDNYKAKNQLLEWLNFWKPGEHDDRTIAILY